ncbi:MAG TPA: hypothetical protein VMS99_00910 [Acidimicrobiia bacterium]|nr:hypothetical protein [Acidimicrobiia bacterium]
MLSSLLTWGLIWVAAWLLRAIGASPLVVKGLQWAIAIAVAWFVVSVFIRLRFEHWKEIAEAYFKAADGEEREQD